MTQRERILAIAVGVVLLLFAGQYVFNTVTRTLDEKQLSIEEAEKKLNNMNKSFTDGAIAAKKMKTLASKSLPKNLESLVAQYKEWLTELGSDSGMTAIRVVPPNGPAKSSEAYTAYNFNLQGNMRIDRVLDLQGKYYDRDYLHRITSLRMSPTAQKDIVSVTMQSQVLALASAKPDQEAFS